MVVVLVADTSAEEEAGAEESRILVAEGRAFRHSGRVQRFGSLSIPDELAHQ